MKRILSVISALTVFAACLSGCSLEDKALLDSMEKTSDAPSYSYTLKLSPSLTVTQPVSNNEAEMGTDFPADEKYYTYEDTVAAAKEDNLQLERFARFLNDFSLAVNTVKDSDKARCDIIAQTSDLGTKLTLWSKADEDFAEAYIKVPSYIPYEKDYLYISSDVKANLFADSEKTFSLLDNLLPLIPDAIKTSFSRKTGDFTYAVNINDTALSSATREITSLLNNNMVVNLISLGILSQADDEKLTLEDVSSGVKSVVEEADARCADFFAELIACGSFADGFTCEYTLNKDGLIEKTAGRISLNVDLTSSLGSDIYDNFFDNGCMYDYAPSGKFSIAIDFSESYSYEASAVTLPKLTESNYLDLDSEISQYARYRRDYDKFNQKYNYPYSLDYEEIPEAISIINDDTDKKAECKTVKVPNFYDENELITYVPLKEISPALGLSISWNADIMGVVVSPDGDSREKTVLLNNDGALLRDLYYSSDSSAISPKAAEIFGDDSYDFAWLNSTGPNPLGYFDESGTAYIQLSRILFVYDYMVDFDGSTLNITQKRPYEQHEENLQDNILYNRFG